MAMEFVVSDETMSRLGRPTLESLRTRLTSHAPCMECGEPLGEGLVAMIGQQVEDKALVLGAHAACRQSEWIRFEDAETLKVPVTGHGTALVEFPAVLGKPGWWERVARLIGVRTADPVLLVFPYLGWAWVELVAPGETVNDDLSLYRDELGMTAGAESPELAYSRAWIDAVGRLVVEVRDHWFATNAPLTRRQASTIHKAGFVHLVVVSGVEVKPDLQVDLVEVRCAFDEGRLLSGTVDLGTRPAE